MSKNVVVVTAMKGEVDLSYKEFCLLTWNHWAIRNNIELLVLEDDLIKGIKPTWQRWKALELLEQHQIDYKQVALVDVDTMIHWDAPNLFEEADNKFSACLDNDNVGWVIQSIEGYSNFFPAISFDWTSYFNCGMVVLNQEHRDLCTEIINFRLQNDAILSHLEKTLRKGTDQTPVNYLVRQKEFKINYLNKKWNLTHLNRKELLTNLMFIEAGWIWHFNGFDKNQRYYLMENTWNKIKSNYGY